MHAVADGSKGKQNQLTCNRCQQGRSVVATSQAMPIVHSMLPLNSTVLQAIL